MLGESGDINYEQASEHDGAFSNVFKL